MANNNINNLEVNGDGDVNLHSTSNTNASNGGIANSRSNTGMNAFDEGILCVFWSVRSFDTDIYTFDTTIKQSIFRSKRYK